MRTVRGEARALAFGWQCDRQQDVAVLDAPFARYFVTDNMLNNE